MRSSSNIFVIAWHQADGSLPIFNKSSSRSSNICLITHNVPRKRQKTPRCRVHLANRTGRRTRHGTDTIVPGKYDNQPEKKKVQNVTGEKEKKTRLTKKQKYQFPQARPLSTREQAQVDAYRALREKFHEGPDYSVLEVASSAARKGDQNRALFDPFNGMPSYSGRYQRKKRTIPDLRRRGFGWFHPFNPGCVHVRWLGSC